MYARSRRSGLSVSTVALFKTTCKCDIKKFAQNKIEDCIVHIKTAQHCTDFAKIHLKHRMPFYSFSIGRKE